MWKGMATYSSILAWRIAWTEVAESEMTEATEHEVKNEKNGKSLDLIQRVGTQD